MQTIKNIIIIKILQFEIKLVCYYNQQQLKIDSILQQNNLYRE